MSASDRMRERNDTRPAAATGAAAGSAGRQRTPWDRAPSRRRSARTRSQHGPLTASGSRELSMIYDPSLSSRLATRMVAGAPAAIVALGLLTLTSCGGGDGDSSSSTPRVESILYSFKGGTADGSASQADLIQASDGDFYGTTLAGGTYGLGTVFRVTPAGVETALWSFGSAGDGASPQAAL